MQCQLKNVKQDPSVQVGPYSEDEKEPKTENSKISIKFSSAIFIYLKMSTWIDDVLLKTVEFSKKVNKLEKRIASFSSSVLFIQN